MFRTAVQPALAVLATLAGLALAPPARAADADLDTGFGSNGIYTDPFDLGGTSRDNGSRLLRTPSGQLWTIGVADVASSGGNLAVARRSATGSAISKTNHAVGGIQEFGDAELDGLARVHAAVTVDGASDGGLDAAVVRLLTNGNLDGTFDGDGIARIDLDNYTQEKALAVEVGADGKVYALVAARNDANNNMLPFGVRLSSTGALEASVPILSSINGAQNSGVMKILGDGRLVVATTEVVGSNLCDIVLVKFQSGTFVNLDTGFGASGVARRRVPEGGTCPTLTAMAIDPAGRILLTGFRFNGFPATDGVVMRLTATGQFDNSFSGNGFAPVPAVFSYNVANAVGVQPDGRIIVAGTLTATDDSFSNILLTRYDSDGSLDSSFNAGSAQRGYSIIASGGQPSTRNFGADLLVEDDGKVVVAGSRLWSGTEDFDFAALRIVGTPRIFASDFE